ncbi:MAG: membrane protein insertase YidC [Chlamydiota bacterium]|nr:membrane protein insertase YidC [Chlamydiota bacterium]
MERRAIIFLIISFAFLVFYSNMYKKMYPPKPAITKPAVEDIHDEALKESKDKDEVSPNLHDQFKDQFKESVSELLEQEKNYKLENDYLKIEFSNIRACIKTMELKESELIRDESVQLVSFIDYDYQTGSLQRIGDFPLDAFYLFQLSDSGDSFIEFTSEYRGLKLIKKYSFGLKPYVVDLSIRFVNETAKDIELFRGYDLNIGVLPKGKHRSAMASELAVVEYDYFLSGGKGRFEKLGLSKIEDKTVFKEEILWGGMKSKYFTLIGSATDVVSNAMLGQKIDEGVYHYYLCAMRLDHVFISSGQTLDQSWQLYLGPMNYQILKNAGQHLEAVMNLEGFWGSLSKGLMFALQSLSRVLFNNYGLAIIVLTIILKLIFYPLSAISLHSMKQMQALQPEMAELKKKHKDNPKKIQQATMALYKEHNVKPLAGCLPMLVQIPIFIAFYKVLMISIELRGADFLWIHNLAGPDTIFTFGEKIPLNILPILNGAAMFFQQKMTPSDPSQKMLKIMMPVMITFFFYSLPSGLILYWFITTLITIFQQYQIQKKPSKIGAPAIG